MPFSRLLALPFVQQTPVSFHVYNDFPGVFKNEEGLLQYVSDL